MEREVRGTLAEALLEIKKTCALNTAINEGDCNGCELSVLDPGTGNNRCILVFHPSDWVIERKTGVKE